MKNEWMVEVTQHVTIGSATIRLIDSGALPGDLPSLVSFSMQT